MNDKEKLNYMIDKLLKGDEDFSDMNNIEITNNVMLETDNPFISLLKSQVNTLEKSTDNTMKFNT